MKPGSIQDWLRPILGAALMLLGAGGLAYKVISGYRHPSADAFVSVQDQNRLAAAKDPVTPTTVSVDVIAAQSTASVTPSAPSAAAALEPPVEGQDYSACTAIETEQHEIEGAFRKPHSPEEGRYLQRRLLELAQQSSEHKCP